TIYLGGGTPSLLGADGLVRTLDALLERFSPALGAEITVEANPDDVSLKAARAWRAAGVNRVSIGAQSFDDESLAWMHRTHTSDQIAMAVEHARAGGIGNVSLDLIFALPESLHRCWELDLQRAVELSPDHLSVYGLTVESQTPLGKWRARGEVAEASDETYETEFLTAHAALTAFGYSHYEVSNYARAGQVARHNSSYWERKPYLGLGPAAHGFDGDVRRWNLAPYVAWQRQCRQAFDPMGGQEVIDGANRVAEIVYLGLRTSSGLPCTWLSPNRVELWKAAGWASVDAGRLRLTPEGWLRLDSLALDLTSEARCDTLTYDATTA
ncbi:MAG: coproporphyrinogen-III oxidase family protein, partial [Gemmatimonadaceae bacterium]